MIAFDMPTVCFDLNGYDRSSGALVDQDLYDTIDNLFNKGYLIFFRYVTGTIEAGDYRDTLDFVLHKEYFQNTWEYTVFSGGFAIQRGESGGGEPA